MLPARAYTAPEVLAWELRHLFAGTWTCLGRLDELLGAGTTQRGVPAGDIPVLLTRDGAGVAALANTCRHRGHELLPEGATSAREVVVCPYHAWTYEPRRRAAGRAPLPRRPGVPARRARARAAAGRGLARLGVRQRHRRRRAVRRAPRGAGRAGRPVRAAGSAPGRPARVPGARQLEGDRRELPRVLPLPAHPSRAVRGVPTEQRRQLRPARRVGRRRDGPARRRGDHVARRPLGRRLPARGGPRPGALPRVCSPTCCCPCTRTT